MVSRREKLSRSYFRLREQTFHKQIAILSSSDVQKSASTAELSALREANHGPNIYDIMYSRGEANQKEGFEQVIQLIGGLQSSATLLKKVRFDIFSSREFFLTVAFEQDKNGVVGRTNHGKGDNPYKRTYMNGGESRRSRSLSSISAESAASDSETNANSKWRREVFSFFLIFPCGSLN